MVRKLWGRGKSAKAEPSRITANPGETFPSSCHLKWSLIFLLVYFGLRLVFFAVTISPYVPPDENTHFELSRIFSTVFFLPQNSPETYEFGLVTNIPWLYYWIMGRLLALNFFGIPDLLFLRLLNIPFAFATVYFVWRTLRLLTDDRLSQMLLVVAMTNTIMFSFLSAFVSYDNLTNLLAAMAVYYLLAFFKNRSGDMLVISFLCQIAGSLTKVAFLPLVGLKHSPGHPRVQKPSAAAWRTVALFQDCGLAALEPHSRNIFGPGTEHQSLRRQLLLLQGSRPGDVQSSFSGDSHAKPACGRDMIFLFQGGTHL
jgi:hypothetical protein